MKSTRSFPGIAALSLAVASVAASILEEASLAFAFPDAARLWLVVSGFAFDLAFSADFFRELLSAAWKRDVGGYLGRGSGWADFLSSVPLLVLLSGPAAYGWLVSGDANASFSGVQAASALLRTLRVSETLRLMRLVTYYGKARKAGFSQTGRHTSFILTMGCAAMVGASIAFSLSTGAIGLPAAGNEGLRLYATIASFFLVMTVAYGLFFAAKVADPIRVMRMNLENPAYLRRLATRRGTGGEGIDDDVAALARAFNERVLPAKLRDGRDDARSLVTPRERDELARYP